MGSRFLVLIISVLIPLGCLIQLKFGLNVNFFHGGGYSVDGKSMDGSGLECV